MSFDSLVNLVLIVLGFGFLIGIHELGHFLAAKWSGIRTNAFAIGMGSTVFSYRKGIGFCYKSTKPKVIAMFGKDATEMSDVELHEHGISETEYSLRLLPIGGFVSMLGQEDGKPDAVSEDPRSYNTCSIGKRMVVVSAGVIMNMLLAAVLFVICFQVGVRFEAPIVGMIVPDSPAAKAIGLDGEHLAPGDNVVQVNGKPARTFTDVQIAGAMAKPGVPVELEVERDGCNELLSFSVLPASLHNEGLLELGIFPASSLTLRSGKSGEEVMVVLSASTEFGSLKQGMWMNSANGESVEVWSQFNSIVEVSGGSPLKTNWTDGKNEVEVTVPVHPNLEVMRLVDIPTEAPQNYERGLLGLCPLTKIASLLPNSPNQEVFQEGDIILSISSLEYPRMGQLRNFLALLPSGDVDVVVLRSGVETQVTAKVHSGKINVLLVDALDLPIIAQPLQETLKGSEVVPTEIANKQVLGGSEIISINGVAVENWRDIRKEFVSAGNNAVCKMHSPTVGKPETKVVIDISQDAQTTLATLGWSTSLAMQMFDSIYTTRSSGGNPIKALQMGFDETVDMLVMTYLTIDRLLRRSVGVDQLRGPIGIVHIGTKIGDRGFSFLLFFLAIISVNLAVLNFLPLPIVDGGLFLYLIYEKLFKKPPSIAFQNAAAVLGLGIIGMLFVVTFYNDIARLVG